MARIFTPAEQIILKGLNKPVTELNKELSTTSIKIMKIDIHLVDRIIDRDIDPVDVVKMLRRVKMRMCEFIFDCLINPKSHVKFGIRYNNFVVHGTFHKTENGMNLISFRTIVLNHNNYKLDDVGIIL